jgi:hypothetical protein
MHSLLRAAAHPIKKLLTNVPGISTRADSIKQGCHLQMLGEVRLCRRLHLGEGLLQVHSSPMNSNFSAYTIAIEEATLPNFQKEYRETATALGFLP